MLSSGEPSVINAFSVSYSSLSKDRSCFEASFVSLGSSVPAEEEVAAAGGGSSLSVVFTNATISSIFIQICCCAVRFIIQSSQDFPSIIPSALS